MQMQWMDGENDLLLTCRETGDGIAVLRCETQDAVVHLPGFIGERPVTALGDYVLAERAPDLSGFSGLFTVRVGRGTDCAHDPCALHRLRVPESVRSVGNYAFYNCLDLEELFLPKALTDVGSDAFLNCNRLHRVQIEASSDGTSCLRSVLREHHGELLCTLLFPDSTKAQLWFPAYSEEYEELAAPHIFGYHIEGAGFTYRQCFDGGRLNFFQYDAALERLLRTQDFDSAVRVALCRLRWPRELLLANRERYSALLAEHAACALDMLLREKNSEDMAYALRLNLFPTGALQRACDRARMERDTEMLGLLMERLHRTGAVQKRSFDL